MPIEAGVGETDEPFVEPFLVGTALVSAHEKDRLPIRVEGEGDASYLALPAKPKFLHVGVLRSLQSVDGGVPEARPKLAEQQGMGEKLILQALGEGLKLAVELVVEEYRPAHGGHYGWKAIWMKDHMRTTAWAPCQPAAGGKTPARKTIANPACVGPGLAMLQLCLGETGKRVGKRRNLLIYNVPMKAE